MGARALFLDRDGVINVDHGYVGTIDRFELPPGILALTRRAVELGYRLVVVTNQAGIARGYYTETDFQTLTAHMRACFAAHGVVFTDVLHSPFHTAGRVAALARDSYWRKPNPGMILEAARRHDLDPSRSVMIGDAATDMTAALRAGVPTRLWLRADDATIPQDATAQVRRPLDAAPFLSAGFP